MSSSHPVIGERKLVSVLFADLVGSTALADDQDAERARSYLERFYAAMSAEIAAAGGTVEKFIGDAVVAVFGAPVAQEDHAERALGAALAMQQRMAEVFAGRLEIRVGVNSGEVVVADASDGASSFVSGDTVNVTARLEQAAGPGEVLVGERTCSLVGGAFELGDRQIIEAKGKPGGIVCRRAIRAVSAFRPRGVGGMSWGFVGRDRELAALTAAHAEALGAGRPRLVTIVGDPGIGKTTLVREFRAGLSRLPAPPEWRSGRCVAYGRGITYWALGEVLKQQFGILESASAGEVRVALSAHPTLAWTMGVDLPEGVHPLAARDRLHEAWVGFVEELAYAGPLVLLVEDVHWAEDPLLDLLETLVCDVDAPLLLLATGRPELLERRWLGNSTRRGASVVELEPFSHGDAQLLVAELFPDGLDRDVEALIVNTAEGNPLFIEELLAALVDQSVLVLREDGNWEARSMPAGFSMPDSVQAVLAARIDLLPAAEKAALQAAAVIGRVFWSGPVYELLGDERPELRMLEERQFVDRLPSSSLTGQREYIFKHALTRQVAYATLAKARRAQLHAGFAGWLEATESRAEHAALLAHHYAEAANPADADIAWADNEPRLAELRASAVKWLARAADVAVARYAVEDGLALLHRALEFEPATETRAEIWRAIGRAHALRYEGDPTLDAYSHAVELTADPEIQAEILSELAFETVQRYGMLNPMPSRDLVDGWIDRALRQAPPDSGARARALVARALWYSESEQDAVEAVEISERLGDVGLRSHAYNARVLSSFVAGRYDESVDWAERRLGLGGEITDPDHLVDIYSMPIPGLLGRARFDEARRYAEMHDRSAQVLSTHHQVHAVAMKLELEELTGGWAQVEALEPRTVDVVEANRLTPCVRNARSLLSCALAAACLGRDEHSARLEEEAGEHDMAGFAPMLAPLRIRLALVRGRHDELERFLAGATPPPPAKNWWRLATFSARLDALAALGDRGRVDGEAPALLVPGTYLEPFAMRALGIVHEDEALITAAAERFRALGLGWHAEQTRAIRVA